MAASGSIKFRCGDKNAAFMKCKAEKGGNPEACLEEGAAVRACVDDLLSTPCDHISRYTHRFELFS